MRGVLIAGVIAAGMMPSGYGQSLIDKADILGAGLGGIHLYQISVFGGYTTSAYPGGLDLGTQPGIPNLGGGGIYGGTFSLGGQYHRYRTDFTLLYSGTYSGMTQYSALNSFNQSVSLAATRKLSAKWTLTLSGTGADTTTAEFLYQPSSAALVSQVPATMDDLAAAFSVGQFSSTQIASTLTGAPLLESPARTLLLGDRVLSYSGQASLSYAPSSRLTFHLASFAAGGQNRLSSGTGSTPQPNYVLPRSIGGDAGMGMSYLLSPRTQIGLDVDESRIQTVFQSGYVTNATASLGRKMGMHWFVRANAGGAINQVTYQAHGAVNAKQLVGGGSLGFQRYRYTLVGSYARTSMDNYGLAVGSISALTAAWNWHSPGSRWNLFTSFTQQRIRNTGYISLSGWEASGGVARALNSHMRMTAQYVYLSNSDQYLGNVTNLAVHSVRVSLSWAPTMAH